MIGSAPKGCFPALRKNRVIPSYRELSTSVGFGVSALIPVSSRTKAVTAKISSFFMLSWSLSTEMLPPACTTEASRGIVKLRAQDATARGKGAKFALSGKASEYGPVTRPFRVTVVLGGESAAAGGQVGQQSFLMSECALIGTTVRCRQPR